MTLMIDDTEALFDHAWQIDTAPARHAIALPIRPRLDQSFQLSLLGGIQATGRSRVLIVAQAIGTLGIEAVNPITQCLAVHAAHPRRPAGPSTDRRQSQPPPRGSRMPAARHKPPQIRRRIIIP
ncbi:hypothetical protein Amme_076_054 [Acidomonas methanolica NBRC 104435]|uniref:Uncharacterized protein n=1 Tax=Acidomonas methanolica NBRC 104435 TaxID=1231351 RepID=A0A023D7L0_ACIMT|nr:hypothetical protein Amme_076_054 [Acidomonas methanolica NBRC 104435]GEL00002.1 hypothetical protein AME01nite_25000 [Acidomonas methanolica NBRC 104435]